MTATTGRRADPVEDYVTSLAAVLRGPARVKARLVEEIRGGLVDATAARTQHDEPYEHAAHRAIREFGTVDELVPSCQQELTIAQSRRTARVVALTTTLPIAYWQFVRLTSDVPHVVQLLGAGMAGFAAVAAFLATTLLAATGVLARWLPTPRRLPTMVAWTGTITSAAMVISALTLGVASAFTAGWPLTVFGGVLAAASHAVLATSARACRACVAC